MHPHHSVSINLKCTPTPLIPEWDWATCSGAARQPQCTEHTGQQPRACTPLTRGSPRHWPWRSSWCRPEWPAILFGRSTWLSRRLRSDDSSVGGRLGGGRRLNGLRGRGCRRESLTTQAKERIWIFYYQETNIINNLLKISPKVS